MNLDDRQFLSRIDVSGMLGHIEGLPEQFETAWHYGLSQTFPDFQNITQIIICGMGGSAIGGDLLGSLMQVNGKLPVYVCRGYELPAWAQGKNTLVIASSFSGNTEETLSAYEQAVERGLSVIAVTTGGKLAEKVKANRDHVLCQFNHQSPPRAALGWTFGLLLAIAHHYSWLPNLDQEVPAAVEIMKKYRAAYNPDVPASQNPAKRQAAQWLERIVMVYGSGVFEVVARRWKTQLNENSKLVCCYEPLPEANHNAVVGIEFPSALMTKIATIFIHSKQYDHPRVALRHELTQNLYLQNGIAIDSFAPDGTSILEQVMHTILYGDYVSFYAAIGNGVDPTVILPIDELKALMAQQS